MTSTFTAPPAQQASSDDLLGERGPNDSNDLPLTAFFRARSATISAAAVVLALAALAGFTVPYLLGR